MALNLKYLVCILSFMILSVVQVQAQKVVDILVYTLENGKKVKHVNYALHLNGKELVSLKKRNGKFEFAIQPNDGRYNLFINKEGYLTKELTFNSDDYPFKEDYDVQEIEVELIPGAEDMEDVVVSRNVGYSEEAGYIIQKLDSTVKVYKSKLDKALNTLETVSKKAIKNADGLVALEEYEYAKGYYEIALDIDPENAYAREQYDKMDVLAKEQRMKEQMMASNSSRSNRGSKTVSRNSTKSSQSYTYLPEMTGRYYSVQLGAFLQDVDESKFNGVDNYRLIDGQDQYRRAVAGSFSSREEADAYKEQMRNLGFKDAFVVSMNGNKRIGF